MKIHRLCARVYATYVTYVPFEEKKLHGDIHQNISIYKILIETFLFFPRPSKFSVAKKAFISSNLKKGE